MVRGRSPDSTKATGCCGQLACPKEGKFLHSACNYCTVPIGISFRSAWTIGFEMARNGYLDRLRTVPAFCHCTHRQLQQVARLVDLVELSAGAVKLDRRELVITLDPVPALVVGRQALPVLLEIAPDLATRRPDQTWGSSRVGHNDCLFVSARACL
jgi:hypothetical protein